GFLATTYNFIDHYNDIAGFDTRYRFNKTTVLTAQVLGSVSHRPFFFADEATTADRKERGLAYAYNLNMDGRNWGYEYSGVGRSRFFRADVGSRSSTGRTLTCAGRASLPASTSRAIRNSPRRCARNSRSAPSSAQTPNARPSTATYTSSPARRPRRNIPSPSSRSTAGANSTSTSAPATRASRAQAPPRNSSDKARRSTPAPAGSGGLR